MFRVSCVLLMVASLGLAGCSTGSSGSQAEKDPAPLPPSMTDEPQDMCDADAVQSWVGRDYQQDMEPQLLSDSGARTLRVLRPNTAATMDLRLDRLNVKLDDNDVITEVGCG
ncbi:I78 family peptidase inhibitor [Halomonas cupida]|uniref:I78 family peptidase inhibitor n=1 Tax=Halomonas cupida TaxID=44933 RepID=UPI003A93317E